MTVIVTTPQRTMHINAWTQIKVSKGITTRWFRPSQIIYKVLIYDKMTSYPYNEAEYSVFASSDEKAVQVVYEDVKIQLGVESIPSLIRKVAANITYSLTSANELERAIAESLMRTASEIKSDS